MLKIETIWHHLLYAALEERRFRWTQQELAERFGYSLSTVNHALEIPSQMGAVRKTAKFFVLDDFEKLLLYWGSVRRLEQDIFYATFFDAGVSGIEGLVPPQSVYAAYTAAKKIIGEPAADYTKVYFYALVEEQEPLEQRLPKNRSQEPNVFALKMPASMSQYGKVTSLPQTFVDLWNLRDWYARDFASAVKERIDGILS